VLGRRGWMRRCLATGSSEASFYAIISHNRGLHAAREATHRLSCESHPFDSTPPTSQLAARSPPLSLAPAPLPLSLAPAPLPLSFAPALTPHAPLSTSAVAEDFEAQEEAGEEGQAEQAGGPLDPFQDQQRDQVQLQEEALEAHQARRVIPCQYTIYLDICDHRPFING
jgi:hypothetical protein